MIKSMALAAFCALSVLGASVAQAEIYLESASLSGDQITLEVSLGAQKGQVTGQWAPDQMVDLRSGAIVARVKGMSDGTFVVLLTSETDDLGVLVILNRQGDSLVKSVDGIRARRSTLFINYNDAIEGMKKTNGWEEAQGVQQMSQYFAQNPAMMLSDFVDQIELGQVNDRARNQQDQQGQREQSSEDLVLPPDPNDGQNGYDPNQNYLDQNQNYDQYTPQPPGYNDGNFDRYNNGMPNLQDPRYIDPRAYQDPRYEYDRYTPQPPGFNEGPYGRPNIYQPGYEPGYDPQFGNQFLSPPQFNGNPGIPMDLPNYGGQMQPWQMPQFQGR